MRHIQPTASVCLALLVTGGCSSIKIGYSLADTLIEREIDDYLDLDSAGETHAEHRVAALMEWHRAKMLPAYASFLRRQADAIEAGTIERDQINLCVAEMGDLWDDTLRGAIPHMAAVLTFQTSRARLAHLSARLKARDDELIEKNRKSADDIVDEHTDKTVEWLERFTGDLDRRQQRVIRGHASKAQRGSTYWMRNHLRRTRAFVDFMGTHPSEAELGVFLDKLWVRPETLSEPDYGEFSEQSRRRFEALLFDVIRSLNAEQRRTMIETLRGYSRDLTELSA